jgi:hypothetical protein
MSTLRICYDSNISTSEAAMMKLQEFVRQHVISELVIREIFEIRWGLWRTKHSKHGMKHWFMVKPFLVYCQFGIFIVSFFEDYPRNLTSWWNTKNRFGINKKKNIDNLIIKVIGSCLPFATEKEHRILQNSFLSRTQLPFLIIVIFVCFFTLQYKYFCKK